MIQDETEHGRTRGSNRWLLCVTLALFAGILTGCDNLLEVELPGQITQEATFTPDQAPVLVASAIADMECSMADFVATEGAGADDAFALILGWILGAHEYQPEPDTGRCNQGNFDYGWYTSLQSGRWMAEQIYSRMDTVWEVSEVPDRETLMAQAAIYAGLAYTQLGEHLCEVTANVGPLMSWDESLAEAENWYDRALGHIGNAGDFAVQNDITPSAEMLAYLLRARTRFAAGDEAGALADAELITQGFTAYVTREDASERTRWNRFPGINNESGLNSLIGPIDWWDGAPNPVTGQAWPDTIPFTGFRNLGILPDGRAISDRGYPITTVEYGTAVEDSRVPAENTGLLSNDFEYWTQQKYPDRGSDIALAKWQEAWLIRAEIEGGQTAIDLVNDIRADGGLPQISGDYETALLSDASLMEDMILEEIRRVHFLEGRFWSTKLRHMDKLWFPRGQDATKYPHAYQTGVRMVMPESEYEINPNLEVTDRGKFCPAHQNPV